MWLYAMFIVGPSLFLLPCLFRRSSLQLSESIARLLLVNISFRRCPFGTPRFVYQVPFEVKFGASFYTNSIKLIMYAFT